MSFFFLLFHTQGNDYSSYHNTLGGHRTGTLLPHASPSSVYNKYSYATDLSLSSNSHYGYTSWGLWRGSGAGGPGTDSRNISPSIYSHHNGSKKRRRNIKSFSILLMSAAMIVVLAVLAVAGLAFYFSTFKSDQSDCKKTHTHAQTNVNLTNYYYFLFYIIFRVFHFHHLSNIDI